MNAQTHSGDSALMIASANGYKECVSLLLESGANVNVQTNSGHSALIRAAADGYEECVILLLEAGVNVNAQTDSGDSALMKALANGYKDCVSLVLEAGGDVNIVNYTGDPALTIAGVNGNVTLAKCLLKANCRINKTSRMVKNALSRHLEQSQSVVRSMSRLLFIAGEILDDDDLKEMMQSLLELNDIKMQLRHLQGGNQKTSAGTGSASTSVR